MQYEPSAIELLAAIAELLEDELLPALPDALKHKCRVAANLTRILQRQEQSGFEGDTRERGLLASLLGRDEDADDLAELSRRLARRITTDDDPEFQRRAWDTLVAIARDDLAISKPGHDAWEGP
ncbi:MAG: DUF6285 domain-containing protein [Acidimicrobiales bacterium]